MTWDESEHPRDEIGRFTFKSGSSEKEENEKEENNSKEKKKEDKKNKYKVPDIDGVFRLGAEINVKPKNSNNRTIYTSEISDRKPKIINSKKETPAQILYKNSRIAKEIEIANRKSKNELLNILGDKATNSDILYGNKETLEKKIEDLKANKKDSLPEKDKIPNFSNPVFGKITSEFGPRKQPTKGASTNHSGLDIAVPIGTPVQVIQDGTIIISSDNIRGYGKAIYVDHGIINGKKVISEYGHLNHRNVKTGDIVKKGEIIGKSGNTGYSSGPHLHITIRENGKPVNPKNYIYKNTQFE